MGLIVDEVAETLPQLMGGRYRFMAAMTVIILDGSLVTVGQTSKLLYVTFAVSRLLAGRHLVILYWDSDLGQWVELPVFALCTGWMN